MKLLVGNGQILEARDVGQVLVRFRARADGPPIKFNGFEVMTDEAARARLEEVRDSGFYERDKV